MRTSIWTDTERGPYEGKSLFEIVFSELEPMRGKPWREPYTLYELRAAALRALNLWAEVNGHDCSGWYAWVSVRDCSTWVLTPPTARDGWASRRVDVTANEIYPFVMFVSPSGDLVLVEDVETALRASSPLLVRNRPSQLPKGRHA